MLFLPAVPSPPLSLNASDVDTSTVSLVWFPPMEPNGILLFYRVVARQVGGNTAEITVDTPADKTEVTANKSDMLMANTSEDLTTANDIVTFNLTNLSPHTEYVITVQANTSAGFGNRSEELHIQTDPGVCVCVRACVCVCVRACVRVRASACLKYSILYYSSSSV